MTTFQKAIIIATITAAIGTAIYEARQASALRSQVQTLQRQQALMPAIDFPKTAWLFAGAATPEATLLSAVWAMCNDDTNAFLSLLTPQEKQNLITNDTFTLSDGVAKLNSINGFSILSKRFVSDDEVVIETRFDLSDGPLVFNNPNGVGKLTMRRYGSEWKILPEE